MKKLPHIKRDSSIHTLVLCADFKSEHAILAHFHIDPKTLEAWHRRGLPKYPVGRYKLFRETELMAFIDKQKTMYPELMQKKREG